MNLVSHIAADVDWLSAGRAVLRHEADAILSAGARMGASFVAACRICRDCGGRVIVTGIGKSGHVGRKIAATLASTGTPAFFLHPAEASHGDLGMIIATDVVLAISNSGETGEMLAMLPLVDGLAVPLIVMTGNPESTLARAADAVLDIGVEREACALNLAPTASTAAAMAMGDALAVSVARARGFDAAAFGRLHPGGTLGRLAGGVR